MMHIGVDTGGTFTDFVYCQDGCWQVYKVLSTPDNPSRAVLEGITHIAGMTDVQVVHGSTVATNAILEHKGATIALVTNEGFEDVLAIGRQNRTELYQLDYQRAIPLVPSERRFGIAGRISSEGKEIEPLDLTQLSKLQHQIKSSGAQAVAVCLLFSYLNPDHEDRVRELLQNLDIPICLSHEILAEFREFERTSTTVINAYVLPKMKDYIHHIAERVHTERLSIMQSNGGSISAQTAMEQSVRTILSGPAGGSVGAYAVGSAAGYSRLVTFDMGGTSTDVCLMDGNLPMTMESAIADFPVKVPMIDIHTVGAGGGSIAQLDQGGALQVGPESAGAAPGPICYGTGTNITVTDANLYLGRLVPEYFLDGGMSLHPERLHLHFDQLANKAGISPTELAKGIITIANANMERAVRVISVERGYNPAEFTLLCFGGAGGLHAASLAKSLGMPQVLVPRNPGILSALGMLMSDVVKDYSLTVMYQQERLDSCELKEHFEAMEQQARCELMEEGIKEHQVYMERSLDMRYCGQSFELMVNWCEDMIEAFHTEHHRCYGYRNETASIEVVNVRLRARGIPEKPPLETLDRGGGELPIQAVVGKANVVWEERELTPVIQRDALLAGNTFQGPAIVVEYTSTIAVPPYARCQVDNWGNLIIDGW
ncbi:hydantoinase/oxoprolinase family protein [Desulfurispira natronophila]|uniref:N-methylhydantoinase A n=1 Tax=Desulfurispira natronophila TaxID=682562 RepID=A0A7W7Y3S2_9BACT|nr:hydantoinase/oxoprolinase family protein [Desulfurispira natronophila]MBB5021399.1 N-methylhydantoinase A [Desulfurispira natronophila]